MGVYSSPPLCEVVAISRGAAIKKAAATTDHCRIRWRLGWHGGCCPLQLRGSVSPPFDGFTLGSVPASEPVMQHARKASDACRLYYNSDALKQIPVTRNTPEILLIL